MSRRVILNTLSVAADQIYSESLSQVGQ
jgi:hypothetical protein